MTKHVPNADRCPTCGLVTERSNRPVTWTLFTNREHETVCISYRTGDRVHLSEFTLDQTEYLAEQMAIVAARARDGKWHPDD